MTTYYVSSQSGSDNNAGTSSTASLATLQAAANLVKPGDTVQVMSGNYTPVTITTSGTAGAPITFEAAPGQTPVINSAGSWNGIDIEASNIVINDFTVVGGAANYTLSQALASTPGADPNFSGSGITIQPGDNGAIPNHITIENNTVYNEPGGGISSIGADYVQILNNTVHDNAHWSAYGASGISVWTSHNVDTNPGTHFTISGNLSYNNTQLVPTGGAGNTITDGEGIILDSNTGADSTTGFTGQFLVQNNTTYGNGGPGIETFFTDNTVITGNTAYGNATQGRQTGNDAQIFVNYSNNTTVSSNATTAPSGGSPTSAPPVSASSTPAANDPAPAPVANAPAPAPAANDPAPAPVANDPAPAPVANDPAPAPAANAPAPAPALTLTINDPTLTVAGRGGTVPLGVTTIDSNDVTVNISGLPRYETITDNLDHQRFRGGGDITLSAAQVNSGLTLHSYYRGTDHPVATLTLTAMDGTGAPSDAQTITVTDPAPATGTTTSSAGQGSGSWGQHHHGWWSCDLRAVAHRAESFCDRLELVPCRPELCAA